MSPLKAIYLHKWKVLLLFYFFATSLSILYTKTLNPSNSEEIHFSKENEKQTLLIFNDPLHSEEVFYDSLKSFFNIIPFKNVGSEKNLSYAEISNSAAVLLDSVDVGDVHVIGTGVGGLSAIHFSSKFKDRVKSLSLVSSNGVVELELLGGHHLNNAVYKTKYGFFIFVKFFTPHFGVFTKLEKKIERARIQSLSDQRLIREQVQRISVPVQIIHTNASKLPEAVSEELYRIIPQSELKISSSKQAFKDIKEFIFSVDEKSTRELAVNHRVVQSLLPFDDSNAIKAEGRALFILMLVIILSTLVSEDLTCIGTGLLIARGLIAFTPGVLACLIGIFVGDILLYLSGRWLASSTLHKAPLKWFISEKEIQKSYYWFKAKGPAIIIASRFIPGTRFPTYFSAGAIGASFWMFILYFGVASIIWTPVLVSLSVFLGQEMLNYFTIYQEYALWVLFGVFFGAYILFKMIIPMFTYRGRRLFFGKWKRITNWEFWPLYVTYFFVFFYLFYLWIKYKSVSLFALSNPGIPEGGFIKESKKEILDGFNNDESIAKYILVKSELDYDEKLTLINDFVSINGLSFPIVIKPDIGERGKGVLIPKSEAELSKLLYELKEDHICQEFIEGEEFGVFYYRLPNQERGQIFSITKKIYLEIVGDGKHTLEELILKDSRAVCLAELHFDKHYDHLFDVPEKGEQVKLVELGTHSRGSIFLDGNYLITQKLTDEIDRISKTFSGFYFGRYDIKVSSEELLARGEGVKVIELNGVTSESTNIYDPKHSFFFGINTLMKQWGIAYEIGSQVKAQKPTLKAPGVKRLLYLLR